MDHIDNSNCLQLLQLANLLHIDTAEQKWQKICTLCCKFIERNAMSMVLPSLSFEGVDVPVVYTVCALLIPCLLVISCSLY